MVPRRTWSQEDTNLDRCGQGKGQIRPLTEEDAIRPQAGVRGRITLEEAVLIEHDPQAYQ